MRQRRVTRLLGMLLLLGALLLAGVSRMPWHASIPVLAQEPEPTSTRPPPAPLATSPPPTAAPTPPPDPPAPSPAATATPSPAAIVLPVAGRSVERGVGWLLIGGLVVLTGGVLLRARRR